MNALQNPKFNVIIPTRERADTLYHCLRTVVAQEYENLTIIVSDNFSQDNTSEVVASFADKRIKYINTGKRLSMSHNWEFALGHATVGWVTFIGDDDGLLPGGLTKVAQTIKDTGCRAITSKWCHYSWPTSTSSANGLTIPMVAGLEVRDSRAWLARALQGRARYVDLPWLYTGGFGELTLINSARDRNGKFFLSMIPDLYSAVALASITDNYVMLHEPVAVAGVSSHSTGASQLGAVKSQVAAQIFFSEDNIPFHPKLGSGRVPSITLLLYECYLQAMHLHQDFLKIDLTDQLELALSSSMRAQYEATRAYCEEVARRNECVTIRVSKFREILRLLGNLNPQLWKEWTATVNARRFNVEDVYGAAVIANAIYVFHSEYSNWRSRKLINRLGYVFERVFHRR